MKATEFKIKKAISFIRKRGGIVRTKDVLKAGIHRRTLYAMRDQGIVTRLERGVYQLSEMESLSNPDLVIVAKRIPQARICLISALAFHELTDEIPHEIHIALPRTSRNPKLDYPPIKVFRFTKDALEKGIQTHNIDGVDIRVYNPAKTIADCFKFRNQIGLSVAIEALNRAIKERKATVKDIIKYTKICRVEKVIQPYLEAVTHGY